MLNMYIKLISLLLPLIAANIVRGEEITLPDRFLMTHSGPFGPAYAVELKDRTLVLYHRRKGRDHRKNLRLPDAKHWKDFYAVLRKVEALKWSPRYEAAASKEASSHKGRWKVDIQFGSTVVRSSGEGAYPADTDPRKLQPRSEKSERFAALERALESLLGVRSLYD